MIDVLIVGQIPLTMVWFLKTHAALNSDLVLSKNSAHNRLVAFYRKIRSNHSHSHSQ
jgi:hypothetical protein